jgi:hypothetical protein
MASGRLGSAVVGSNRTLTIYDNTSGSSASISLIARMKSSTSNGTLSILLEASATAPETSTQISTTSFTKEVLKLFYNSVVPGSVSSVTAKFEYSTYGNANRGTILTELPGGATTSGLVASERINPLWMTSDWSDWGVGQSPSNGLIGLTRGDSSGSVRYFTQAQIDSAGLTFTKSQINANSVTTPSGTYDNATSASYANRYGAIDIYCNLQPYWTVNGSAYMGVVFLDTNGNQARNHTRSSNSLMYQRISNSDPGTNDGINKISCHASGGIVIYTHNSNQTTYIVCYGRSVAANSVIEQVIEDNQSSSGSGYPLHYKTETGNVKSSSGFYTINFFEYNPNTEKSYALMHWYGKRRLLEFDVAAWEAALAADTGSTSTYTFDQTVTSGLITDISSGAPSFFTNDGVILGGPIVRTAKSKWVIPLRSGSTYNIYETTDFKTYTLYSTTSAYTETLDSVTSVISDGSDTDKVVSNFDTLNQAGLLEENLSFNDYERTGLVISNNDRVIVRNSGTENISFNVMGYEGA